MPWVVQGNTFRHDVITSTPEIDFILPIQLDGLSDDDEKRALCSLRTALLRGSLCKQLRILLQHKGWHIPVAVGEHRMIPRLPSMPYVP